MPRSPFQSLVNATLTFTVIEGTKPNAAGNPTIATRSIPVQAYLKLNAKRSKNDLPKDFPKWAEAWEGWAVEPMILPAEILVLARAKATIAGDAGEFILDGINPPYGRTGLGAVMAQQAGSKITGWFVRNGSVQ